MSKYQILRILLIALCIGLASATMAEPSQSEIKDILVQALELQEHGTYQADLSLAGSTITIQQKQLSDGTVGRRATLKRSVSLENKHGSFDCGWPRKLDHLNRCKIPCILITERGVL